MRKVYYLFRILGERQCVWNRRKLKISSYPPTQTFFGLIKQSNIARRAQTSNQRLRDEPKECLHRRLLTLMTSFHFPTSFLSISNTFAACVCNDTPILSSFSILSTFSKALGLSWPGWPHTEWPRNAFIRKKSSSLDVEESEHAGSFERYCQVCFTGHLLNMGMNNLFLFLIRWQKKWK